MSDMLGKDRLQLRLPLALPDLVQVPWARLVPMRAAGAEVLECLRVLDKGGVDPVSEALVRQRDAMVAAWQRAHLDSDVFEDRQFEVAAECVISVEGQVSAAAPALHGECRLTVSSVFSGSKLSEPNRRMKMLLSAATETVHMSQLTAGPQIEFTGGLAPT